MHIPSVPEKAKPTTGTDASAESSIDILWLSCGENSSRAKDSSPTAATSDCEHKTPQCLTDLGTLYTQFPSKRYCSLKCVPFDHLRGDLCHPPSTSAHCDRHLGRHCRAPLNPTPQRVSTSPPFPHPPPPFVSLRPLAPGIQHPVGRSQRENARVLPHASAPSIEHRCQALQDGHRRASSEGPFAGDGGYDVQSLLEGEVVCGGGEGRRAGG